MRIPWGCRGNPQNGDWDSNETMLIEKKNIIQHNYIFKALKNFSHKADNKKI